MPKSLEKPHQASPEEKEKEMLKIEEYFYKKYNCRLDTGWNTIALIDEHRNSILTAEEEKMRDKYDAYRRENPKPKNSTEDNRRVGPRRWPQV